MADPEQRAASDPMAGAVEEDYDKFFTKTPDPWVAISGVDYGADTNLASTVEAEVMMADPGQRKSMEKRLLSAFAGSVQHPAAVMMICKLLACVGGDDSVKPLTTFLKNPETSDAARRALQAIPGEAVNTVLRESLTLLTGEKLAGVIGTVAARHDTLAIPDLQKLANDSSQLPVVHIAAQRALEFLAV